MLLERTVFCCFSIYSSYEKLHEEIIKLKEIFKRNSYSEKVIYIYIYIYIYILNVF